MPRPPRFTIRVASTLTGINQNTLRAWERRHGLIRPERTPKGYRLYSDEDLDRLRLIQHALAEGVPISRVGAHLESVDGTTSPAPARGPVPPGRATKLVEVSLAAAGLRGSTTIRLPARDGTAGAAFPLGSFAGEIEQAASSADRARLERAFARAVGLHGLHAAFHHALAPALACLEARARENPASAAAHALLRAFAHERLLASLAGLRPLHQPARAIFACGAADPDEFRHVLLALELGLQGVSVHFLAPGLPLEGIVRAARNAGSGVVAFSAAPAGSEGTLLDLRDRLAALPRRPRLFAAGAAARAAADWLDGSGIGVLAQEVPAAASQLLLAISRD